MNAYIVKAILITLSLAGLPLMYFFPPRGVDRWFAVSAWLVFAGISSTLILLMPMLHCPHCGRATSYFDTYTETVDRLQGGRRRHIQCKHCHSIIDRLSRTVVTRLPKAKGRSLIRFSFLLGIGRLLCTVGYGLVVVSIFFGALVL